MNCSKFRPADRMMARRVPRSSSSGFGTTTWAYGRSRRRMIWLPCCRLTANPALIRATTQAAPERRGSFTPRPGRHQSFPRVPANRPPAGPRRRAGSPRGYWQPFRPWFDPGSNSLADWGTPRSSSRPLPGKSELGALHQQSNSNIHPGPSPRHRTEICQCSKFAVTPLPHLNLPSFLHLTKITP